MRRGKSELTTQQLNKLGIRKGATERVQAPLMEVGYFDDESSGKVFGAL